MNKEKEKGMREVCEIIHKFCLKEGMDCEPGEQRAYTQVIIFLTNKFGYLREGGRTE